MSEAKKVRLFVLKIGASYSQTRAYTIVLNEFEGKRRLPIFSAQHEAYMLSQAMAKEIVEIRRPTVYNIIKEFVQNFEIKIKEVLIYKFVNGIFYSKLIFEHNEKIVEIEANTPDALAIAYILEFPVYTYSSILSNYGVTFNFEEEEQDSYNETDDEEIEIDEWANYSKEELHQMLESAIEEEDFERASKIRDALKDKH